LRISKSCKKTKFPLLKKIKIKEEEAKKTRKKKIFFKTIVSCFDSSTDRKIIRATCSFLKRYGGRRKTKRNRKKILFITRHCAVVQARE